MLHMHSSIWIRTGCCSKTTSPDASHSEYQRGLSRRGAKRKYQATSLKQRGNKAELSHVEMRHSNEVAVFFRILSSSNVFLPPAAINDCGRHEAS